MKQDHYMEHLFSLFKQIPFSDVSDSESTVMKQHHTVSFPFDLILYTSAFSEQVWTLDIVDSVLKPLYLVNYGLRRGDALGMFNLCTYVTQYRTYLCTTQRDGRSQTRILTHAFHA